MASIETLKIEITPDTMIPELLEAYPSLRPIFDRYGLHGCGGERGPAETLKFFARAHGVDQDLLLQELRQEAENPSAMVGTEAVGAQAGQAEGVLIEDIIYRRFFKAGIVTTLTAGALWGAILLLNIALKGSFTALSIHDINAHGHAQIMGWVGLFVMGFAYQAFPRFKQLRLYRPDLANLTFYLMVLGIILRVVGEPFSAGPFFLWLGLTGTVLEVAATVLFGVVIGGTLKQGGGKLECYDGYIIAALFWFFLQAIWDLMLFWLTATATTREILLARVATYQAPLRDMQIHGFALTMILGVSQRYLSGIYNFRKSSNKLSLLALGLITAAVFGESGFFVLLRLSKNHLFGIGLYLSFLVLAGTVVALTRTWGLFTKTEEWDRNLKFIRVAYLWLYLSLLMLLFMPFYNQYTDQAFSHAYFGATRHAITVGFISMMILGVAGKVVPTLNGIDVRTLGGLWAPFILVNLGSFLRVSTQVLTDFTPIGYRFIGFSGLMEVSGLALWAYQLWKTMGNTVSSSEIPESRPERVIPGHRVGWLAKVAPELIPVFVDRGFTLLRNPVLRATLAQQVTVRQACSLKNIQEESLIEELNEALARTHSIPD